MPHAPLELPPRPPPTGAVASVGSSPCGLAVGRRRRRFRRPHLLAQEVTSGGSPWPSTHRAGRRRTASASDCIARSSWGEGHGRGVSARPREDEKSGTAGEEFHLRFLSAVATDPYPLFSIGPADSVAIEMKLLPYISFFSEWISCS